MECTWVDCKKEAKNPQLDNNGKEWANLCDEHHSTIEDSIKNLNPKKMLGCWVKAQGGAKKAAERTCGVTLPIK